MRPPFEGIFGNSAELRLLNFLLPLDGLEFDRPELAEEAGISLERIDRIVTKFLEWGILKVSSTAHDITWYQLDRTSPLVRAFDRVNYRIIEMMIGPEVSRFLSDLIDEKEQLEGEEEKDAGSSDAGDAVKKG